jgi:hypothetical protein
MPIFYVPDNTPSRNYSRNSRTEGYAHPAHGTPGVLAKSDTDPRNRGRRRSREEIEDSSRARSDAKRERLDKLREGVETKKAADKEAKEAKRLRVTADKSAAALANNPEAARREIARQQTAAAAEAKRGKPVTRLTAEQQEAGRAANQEANRRAAASRPVDTMHLMSERMKPEGPSLSDTLAASEAAGRPHVARSVSNLFANQQAAPETAQSRDPRARPLETPQPELAAALTAAMKPEKQQATTFSSREEMEQAAMNPSGAATPTPKRQGFYAGVDAQSKALSNLPESDRKFVENQYRDLQEQGFVPNFLESAAGLFSGSKEPSSALYDSVRSIDRGIDAIANPITAGFNNAASGALAIKDTVDSAISSGVESTVNDATNAMNAFKPSMSFRPGMEFGEPKSRPTAIGANATGIGAAPPERKKQDFMDWLRSNLPESFSDPNSMYYFPGKYY